jgi:signal recognition particle receptor subunit beta
MDTSTIFLYLLILLSSLALFYFFFFSSASSSLLSSADCILLYGPMSSGKSLLFYKLKTDQTKETVTSMKENSAKFVPVQLSSSAAAGANSSFSAYNYIDFPGHPSQKHKLSNYINNLRAIVFCIDSNDQAQLSQATQYLFPLLTDGKLNKRKIPLFIALTKSASDNPEATQRIQQYLEGSLDKARKLQSSMPDITNTAEEQPRQLGRAGQPFKFSHSNLPITIDQIDAATNHLQPLLNFLRKL